MQWLLLLIKSWIITLAWPKPSTSFLLVVLSLTLGFGSVRCNIQDVVKDNSHYIFTVCVSGEIFICVPARLKPRTTHSATAKISVTHFVRTASRAPLPLENLVPIDTATSKLGGRKFVYFRFSTIIFRYLFPEFSFFLQFNFHFLVISSDRSQNSS